MLTKRTVLVLGAGASKPYNYPTGLELSQYIVDQLGAGNVQHQALVDLCGFNAQQIEAFRLAFFRSGKNSIDAFLEHRPDLMTIGKAAIAAVMLAFQNSSLLFQYAPTNWLRYLYNNLNTTFDNFGDNRLSFVTFNYDRTVEHFLFSSLKNSYDKSDEECNSLLRNIPSLCMAISALFHGKIPPESPTSRRSRNHPWRQP